MLYPELNNSVKYVVFNTYHSGTLNTKSEQAKAFFDTAAKKGITVYATAIYDGPQYESADAFEKLHILPIKNMSPIAAYVKLWLLSAMNKDAEQYVNASLSGDVV